MYRYNKNYFFASSDHSSAGYDLGKPQLRKIRQQESKNCCYSEKRLELDTNEYFKVPVIEYFQKNKLEGTPVKNGSKIPVNNF